MNERSFSHFVFLFSPSVKSPHSNHIHSSLHSNHLIAVAAFCRFLFFALMAMMLALTHAGPLSKGGPPRELEKPGCAAYLPEEPCFRYDCWGRGRWDILSAQNPPFGQREVELSGEAHGPPKHNASTVPPLVPGPYKPFADNDPFRPDWHRFDPSCCQLTWACWRFMVKEWGQPKDWSMDHSWDRVKMKRTDCCVELLTWSCRDPKDKPKIKTPKALEPPPQCTNPDEEFPKAPPNWSIPPAPKPEDLSDHWHQ